MPKHKHKLLILLPLLSLFLQAQTYNSHRSIIGRTLTDLRHASRFAHGGKEHERIDNAQRHLHEFDRALSRGRYDQSRFDEAIDDLHNVVRNNNLPPRERDVLNDDLQGLRALRARERRY